MATAEFYRYSNPLVTIHAVWEDICVCWSCICVDSSNLYCYSVPVALILICIPASAQRFTCSSNGQHKNAPFLGTATRPIFAWCGGIASSPALRAAAGADMEIEFWVDQGCRADFVIGPDNYDNRAYQGGPDYDHDRDHDRDHQGPGWDRPPAYYSGNFSDGHRPLLPRDRDRDRSFVQSGGAFTYANPLRVNGACVQYRTSGRQPIRLMGRERLRGQMGDQTRRNSLSQYPGGPGYDRDRDHDRDHQGGPIGGERPPD